MSSEVVNAPGHVRIQQIHGYRCCIRTKPGLSRQGCFWTKGELTFSGRGAVTGKGLEQQVSWELCCGLSVPHCYATSPFADDLGRRRLSCTVGQMGRMRIHFTAPCRITVPGCSAKASHTRTAPQAAPGTAWAVLQRNLILVDEARNVTSTAGTQAQNMSQSVLQILVLLLLQFSLDNFPFS
ncbi:uncharacterized protein ACIB01_013766 isoform 1-T1 [Guaruba guarouba]